MDKVSEQATQTGFTPNATLYDATRQRIVDVVRDTGLPGLDAPVAACPGWTVGDVVAHLAGGLGDFLNRRFDAGEHENFGERTVHERRGRALEENLAEWETHRAAADPLFESPMAGVLVAEIVSHEHDIRTALDRPGARDDESVRAAIDRPLREIDRKIREAGLSAVRIVVDGDTETVLGDGEPARALRVSAFELLRTIGGRRSRAQIRALDWDGEPELDAFALFGAARDTDLIE